MVFYLGGRGNFFFWVVFGDRGGVENSEFFSGFDSQKKQKKTKKTKRKEERKREKEREREKVCCVGREFCV